MVRDRRAERGIALVYVGIFLVVICLVVGLAVSAVAQAPVDTPAAAVSNAMYGLLAGGAVAGAVVRRLRQGDESNSPKMYIIDCLTAAVGMVAAAAGRTMLLEALAAAAGKSVR